MKNSNDLCGMVGIHHLAVGVGGSHPVQITMPGETNVRYLLHPGQEGSGSQFL